MRPSTRSQLELSETNAPFQRWIIAWCAISKSFACLNAKKTKRFNYAVSERASRERNCYAESSLGHNCVCHVDSICFLQYCQFVSFAIDYQLLKLLLRMINFFLIIISYIPCLLINSIKWFRRPQLKNMFEFRNCPYYGSFPVYKLMNASLELNNGPHALQTQLLRRTRSWRVRATGTRCGIAR